MSEPRYPSDRNWPLVPVPAAGVPQDEALIEWSASEEAEFSEEVLAAWVRLNTHGGRRTGKTQARETLAAYLADLLRGARAEALRDFCQWIAFNRVYNGADDPGQSLYNEGLNGHLPKWAEDYLVARADHPAPDHRARSGLGEGE